MEISCTYILKSELYMNKISSKQLLNSGTNIMNRSI